jgi:hypothetical protein
MLYLSPSFRGVASGPREARPDVTNPESSSKSARLDSGFAREGLAPRNDADLR